MRFLPSAPAAVAGLIFWLSPAGAWAQQLHCAPCSYDFGQVRIGSSRSYAIQLSNNGNKILRIASKSEHGSAFSFGKFPLPVRLQPGTSIQLPVIFTPTANGHASGILTLASNDPNSPLTMHVRGTGFYTSAPKLGVTPSTLTFGNIAVGTSASLQATLTASNNAVTISSDQSTSSEFAILGLNLPATIQAGQSVQFTIQFTPNASGTAAGEAEFVSNAVNSPTVERLTGTGVAQGSHSVDLSWDPGSGNPVGYNVYRGNAYAGPFQMINTVLDASTNYTDDAIVSGTTYYYVTTQVDAQGQESPYSNEVKAVIPSP
jgi:Abnormal spindle-like microcephaly-assoc'd, ASPM-SPD-2-Hydin